MKKIVVLMIAIFVLSFVSVASAQEIQQWTNPDYQMLYRGDPPPPDDPPPQDPPPKHKKPKHKEPPAPKPAPPPESPQPPLEPAPRW